MNGLALSDALLHQVEELPRHDRAGVELLLGPTLGDNIGGTVGALDALVSG